MAATISRQPSVASQHAPSIRSQKPPLPHVSTLWQNIEASNRGTFDARKTLSSQRPAKQRSRPPSPTNKSSIDLRNTPNIHLLAMPDLGPGPGEFKPAKQQHRRNNSSDIHSPASTQAPSIHNGSIFELPSMPNESPNSSIRTSFLAELEDTSGLDQSPVPPLPTQLAPPTDTSILFKTNKLTSQAILRVVDETIAGIEAANRELLARAEAAEASAYRLHVSNTELRNRVEELSVYYKPKTAPVMRTVGTQTTPQSPRNSPRPSINHLHDPNPSPKLLDRASPSFSKAKEQIPLPSPQAKPQAEVEVEVEAESQPKPRNRKSIRSLKFLHRHHAEAFSLPLSNASSATLNKQTRASSDRPRTADGSTASKSNAPPLPELPIFLSLTSHAVNPSKSKHTRSLSAEEAKKLKTMQVPMPANLTPPLSKTPIGEMSPSPVHGVVEIGLGGPEEEETAAVKPLKSQRSRVRFLLKETMIRELIEGEREKKRDKKEREKFEKEGRGEKGEKDGKDGQRKISGFWKRGNSKKGEEAIPPVPVLA